MSCRHAHDPSVRVYRTAGGVEITRRVEALPQDGPLENVLAHIAARRGASVAAARVGLARAGAQAAARLALAPRGAVAAREPVSVAPVPGPRPACEPAGGAACRPHDF